MSAIILMAITVGAYLGAYICEKDLDGGDFCWSGVAYFFCTIAVVLMWCVYGLVKSLG
jgi:predicted MFS family arabinose efflux permease